MNTNDGLRLGQPATQARVLGLEPGDLAFLHQILFGLSAPLLAKGGGRTEIALAPPLREVRRAKTLAPKDGPDGAATWLVRELGLPASVTLDIEGPRDGNGDEHARSLLRSLGRRAKLGEPAPGVAAWACGAAPALGVSAKTLANSVSGTLRSERSDHRWLRVLARVSSGHSDSDAWCYHRRTPAALGKALGSMAVSGALDAGDAVIVLSLLALWQRRRSTALARGNRGRHEPRRSTPKPLAALIGGLVQPSQPTALVKLAMHLAPDAGRAVPELALEAALTEAHLSPHPSRSVVRGRDQHAASESWLKSAQLALNEANGMLHGRDAAVFAFRIERQRAWREARPQPDEDESLRSHPYVAACLALERKILDPFSDPGRLEYDSPGVLMQLPALRARDLLEVS